MIDILMNIYLNHFNLVLCLYKYFLKYLKSKKVKERKF